MWSKGLESQCGVGFWSEGLELGCGIRVRREGGSEGEERESVE